MTAKQIGGPRRVTIVGSGVIGTSWTALFLAQGLAVTATDPGAGAEQRLRESVERLWPVLERLGTAADASPDRLSFTTNLAKSLEQADFVQENAPEKRIDKQRLIQAIDGATRPGVVIASSSSGLLPSELQMLCEREPGRVLVGHPFHPPHLMPLVEVVGGQHTDESAIDKAMAFYRALGKRPIRIRRELPGHVANRLQAALWREAFSLVEDLEYGARLALAGTRVVYADEAHVYGEMVTSATASESQRRRWEGGRLLAARMLDRKSVV